MESYLLMLLLFLHAIAQDECLREESRFHHLTSQSSITRIKLERAEQEKKWLAGNGRLLRDFASFKDLYAVSNKLFSGFRVFGFLVFLFFYVWNSAQYILRSKGSTNSFNIYFKTCGIEILYNFYPNRIFLLFYLL